MFRFIIILQCLLLTQLQGIQSACDEAQCRDQLGEFAECNPEGRCDCKECYVPFGDCIPIASYNRTCSQNVQCKGALGENSRCNPSTKLCECYSVLGDHVHYHDGRCYILKSLGEPCTEDNQCILGMNGASNPLARCMENVCSCYQDPEISLVTHDMAGICMAHCEECTVIDLSVLAVTMAGTVVLILFIYVIFQIAKRDREDELSLVGSIK